MREIMVREAQTCDLKELVAKFIPEVIGKEIEKATSGIYPLQNTYIRKVKILKAPKFDLTKLMEVSMVRVLLNSVGYCTFHMETVMQVLMKFCIFPNWGCTLECRSTGTTVRRLVQRLSVQWEMTRKQKLRLLRYLGLRQHATQFAVSRLVDIKDWIFLHPTMVVVAIHLRCITNG
jgi:hypothetical protein